MKAILSKNGTDETDVRVDIAVKLFYRGKAQISELGRGNAHYLFSNWLWQSLGERCGHLRKGSRDEVRIVIPDLDGPSLEFLARLISPWVDEIRMEENGAISGDMWAFPVSSLLAGGELGEDEQFLKIGNHHGQDQRFLMPLLGPTRLFARIETIPPGINSARLHSHSSVDEYYLVLDGEGTLRMNGRERVVRKGDFIAKPSLPENTSQILANRGEEMRILDMEVWPDSTISSKDLVDYPDHREFLLRGTGWGSAIPSDAAMPPGDIGKNYDSGYRRKWDGSWEGKEIEGYGERQ